MADQLMITGLEARCRVGLSEEERAQPQTIWLDLELAIDAAKAAARDDVLQTIDYAALVEAVRRQVEHEPYRLLETVAEGVAKLILQEFGTPEVVVRVRKRALPGIESAAVEVTRSRR